MRSRIGRRLFSLTAIGLLAVSLTAAWWAGSDLRKGWLAANVVASIDADQPADLSLPLTELDALGRPGQEALIDLLDSPSGEVARAAQAKLLARIAQWRELPAQESTPRVALLAQSLADRAPLLDSRGVTLAKHIALELLSWPTRGASSALVVDCETVLRLDEDDDARVRTAAASTEVPPQEPKESRRSHQSPPPASASVELPGGGLPIDVAAVEANPLETAEQPPRPLKVVKPQPLTEEPPQYLRPPYATPVPAPRDRLPPAPPELFRPDEAPVKPLAPEQTGDLRGTTAAEAQHFTFEGIDSFELMELLHDDESDVARQAVGELRSRGFTDRHLKLARLLTSPDAEKRLEFVSLLPRLPDLDPRPWLMRLSYDPDPRVRRAALGVMAATRDPRLLDRARAGTKSAPSQRSPAQR
jgi:hypothetical protein